MNKSGDDNRSVRNTKRRLHEALLALMHQKPIKEITIKELTDLANVNRGTFYFHYHDIYELLQAMEDDFFARFDAVVNMSVAKGNAYGYLMAIFSFLGENHQFCRVFLGPHGDRVFVERVKDAVDARCSMFWRSAAPAGNERRFGLYNAFIINGCMGVIETWLSNGMQERPEEIAGLIAAIVNSSVTTCISA